MFSSLSGLPLTQISGPAEFTLVALCPEALNKFRDNCEGIICPCGSNKCHFLSEDALSGD